MPDTKTVSADALIQRLQLAPHPEGGHFRRIHEAALQVQCGNRVRAASTAIDFLLKEGQCSQWHRVDADELWFWRAGDALCLQVFDPQADAVQSFSLGDTLAVQDAGGVDMVAFHAVPAGCWQRAWTAAPWSLVNCVVTPGFEWEGFALIETVPEIAARLRALDAL
ncbi:cupin domain-containing protein [Pseudoxanthomonas sp.]|uniref:cupin domain-containing protein n=1 Tax=Pseudoxanthomonas sp. TaxID=1871049 RepID=UPI0026147359|nr:cupin domain-containing protein [Pseudoxanthomonas sp.]WDS36309.1 MAG: cupin domain-containing protein [Pseudoxanthomonas sp.]